MILFAVQMYLPVLLHLAESTIKLDVVADPSLVCKILPFNDQRTIGAGFLSIRQVKITVVFCSTAFVVFTATFSTCARTKVQDYAKASMYTTENIKQQYSDPFEKSGKTEFSSLEKLTHTKGVISTNQSKKDNIMAKRKTMIYKPVHIKRLSNTKPINIRMNSNNTKFKMTANH